jgi:hypothetical protein
MLCRLCSEIAFDPLGIQVDNDPFPTFDETPPLKSYFVYEHQPSLDALFASAEGGCHLCILIRSELFHIRGHESEEDDHQGPVEVRLYVTDEEAGISGDFSKLPREVHAVARTKMRDVRTIFNFVEYGCELGICAWRWQANGQAADLASLLEEKAENNPLTIECEENFKLAIRWLNDCLKHHSMCTISTLPNPPLPSRVLDVDSDLAPSKLALVSSEGRHGPYLTLSHVWGKAQIITTTRATLSQRLAGIELADLSRTFRHAVRFARAIHVRYIWIDSLCIVQDDLKDWEKESVKMGQYYTNSLLTIAAVGSSDGNGGLLLERNALEVTPCSITMGFESSSSRQTVTGFLRPITSWDPALQVDGYHRPPLWQRAWVLQERLLSSRIIMCSKLQMSWKCRSGEASENCPEGTMKGTRISQEDAALRDALIESYWGKVKGDQDIFPAGNLVKQEYKDQLSKLYDAWYDLVMLYGKCGLTKESDIFPAISGIANAINKATGDIYFAGLWKNDIHRGLLWGVPDSAAAKPDLREPRAPSWSWASLRGTCTFHVRQISQARMKVKTHAKVSFSDTPRLIWQRPLEVNGKLKRAHPMDRSWQLEEESIFKAIPHDHETLFDLERKEAVGWYFADNVDKKCLPEIWCFLIMTEEQPGQIGEEISSIPSRIEGRGIALLPLDRERKVYMRVGSVWVRDADWFASCITETFTMI